MYRTRDWRRAQRQRYIKRVWRVERDIYCHVQFPDPIGYQKLVDKYGIDGANRYAVFATWEQVFEYRWKRSLSGAKTRVFCSGPCCGNQRKHYGHITKQEQRFALHCEAEY